MVYHASRGAPTKARVHLALLLPALGAVLLGVASASGSATWRPRQGGVFRIAFLAGSGIGSPGVDFIDPALAYTASSWALLDTTCARLLTYPDTAPSRGFRLQPEVASGYPRVTNGGRTFTFTLRRNFRFSNGAQVRADAFARAIDRTLDPKIPDEAPVKQHTEDIVGAAAVQAGRRTRATGVVAKGYRLTVTLKQPSLDFPERMTTPFFCAVPPSLPVDPEGVHAPLHAAGPYYISEYVPNRRVVLRRNRYYGGTRPHHVEVFRADLTSATGQEVAARIDSGRADWGIAGAPLPYFLAGFDKKYGINRARFFLKPGLNIRGFALNVSRPLFRNPKLRRAVNYAIDRAAIRRATPGGIRVSRLTDQYLPPRLPAYRNANIYPLARQRLGRAKTLARGLTRNRKAVIYTFAGGPPVVFAQIAKRNLEQIGLEAEVRAIPNPFERIAVPGEPWDLALMIWAGDYSDPYAYLNVLFDGRYAGRSNASRFDSPRYNRLLRQAARRRGGARERAYARLDARLARDAAPFVAVDYLSDATFISRNVDPRCVVLRPTPGWGLDLPAVCLNR